MEQEPIRELTNFSKIDNAESLFKQCVDILDEDSKWYESKRWFVGFGNALGLYRDGDFIPNDTDFDFVVLGDDRADELMEKFAAFLTPIRLLKHEGKQMQAAFQHENGIVVDICFYHKDGDTYYSNHDGTVWRDEARLVEKPKLRKTKYGKLPFPHPIEDYLEARYGDWKVKQNKGSISE